MTKFLMCDESFSSTSDVPAELVGQYACAQQENVDITPHTDYETWILLVIDAISKNEDFSKHIDECNELISQILEYDSLLDDISIYTENFLTSINEITELCLNDDSRNEQKQQEILDFLKSISLLFSWEACHKHFDLAFKLIGIFSEDHPYYSSSKRYYYSEVSPFFSAIVHNFVELGYLEILSMQCIDCEELPVLENFFIIFYLVTNLSKYFTKEDPFVPSLMDDVIEAFYAKICNSENIPNYDQSRLIYCFSLLLSMNEIHNVDVIRNIDSFLSFLNNMLNIDFQDRDNLVVSLLLLANRSSEKKIVKPYVNWLVLNFDYLSKLSELPMLCSKVKPLILRAIEPQLLIQYWEIIQNSRIESKASMLDIAISSLKILSTNISEDQTLVLFKKLMKFKISEQLLIFYTQSILLFQKIYPSLAQNILNYYLFNCTSDKYCELSIKLIEPICETSMVEFMIKTCCNQINMNQNMTFNFKLLQSIFQKSNNDYGLDFYQIVQKSLSNSSVPKEIVLDFYMSYMIIMKKTLDREQFNLIMENADDNKVWKYLSDMIKYVGIVAFDDNVFSEIKSIFATVDNENISYDYVDFVKLFCRYSNYKSGKILSYTSSNNKSNDSKLIPSEFKLKAIPIDMEECLFNILLEGKDNSTSIVEQELINYYTNVDPSIKVESFRMMHQIIQVAIQQCCRLDKMLIFFYHYLIENEKFYDISDFNMTRHKYHPITEIVKINVEYKNMKITLSTNVKSSYYVFRERAAFKLGINPMSINLTFGGYSLSAYKQLSEANLMDGSLVIAKEVFTKANISQDFELLIPTVYFHRIHFTQVLLQLLEDPEVDKIAWKILKYFPDDEQFVRSLDDIGNYLQAINETHTTLVAKYYIQILSNYRTYQLITKQLINNNGYDILIPKIDIDPLSILQLLSSAFTEALTSHTELIVPLIGYLENPKLMKASLELLSSFEQYVCADVTREIINNIKIFGNLINNAHEDCVGLIWKVVQQMNRLDHIFQLCLADIDKPRFSELLIHLVPFAHDYVHKLLKELIARLPDKCALTIMERIFQNNQKLLQTSPNTFVMLIEFVLNTDDLYAKSRVFQILFHMQKGKEDISDQIVADYLEDFHTNIYNFNEINYSKSMTGFVGLKNLGATCYLNSIIQQLYHSIGFYNSFVPIQQFDQDGIKEIQTIFCKLSLSNSRALDMKKFLQTWKWYGKLIDPHEQQDANEFFQLLLDQLPDSCHKIFEGKFLYTIQLLDNTIISQQEESFFTIPIDIKGFENVNLSLASYFDPDMLINEDQYIFNDQKVNAKRTITIKEIPKVLVLHLKRFQYNFQTNNRHKIQDKCSFPLMIDLSKYINDSGSSMKYDLKGVVLHSGTADAGHYHSDIMIGNEWFRFNDSEITPITYQDVMNEGFGQKGGVESLTNAYMLFYTLDDENMKVDISQYISEELMKEIQSENELTRKIQTLMSEDMIKFMSKSKTQEVFLEYFYSVFIHISSNSFFPKYLKKLSKYARSGYDTFVEITNQHIDDIIELLKRPDVAQLSTQFVDKICETKMLGLRPLAERVLNEMKDLPSWIPCIMFSKLIYSYAFNDNTVDWTNQIIDIIITILTRPRFGNVLKNIDISLLFDALALMVKDTDYSQLLQVISQVYQQPLHEKHFIDLLEILINAGKIPSDVYSILPVTPLTCLNSLIVKITKANSDLEIIALMKEHLTDEKLYKELIQLYERRMFKIRETILQFPVSTLLQFLFIDDVSSIVQSLIRKLFDEANEEMLNFFNHFISLSEEILIPKFFVYVQNQHSLVPFILSFKWLAKNLNSLTPQVLDILNKLLNYSLMVSGGENMNAVEILRFMTLFSDIELDISNIFAKSNQSTKVMEKISKLISKSNSEKLHQVFLIPNFILSVSNSLTSQKAMSGILNAIEADLDENIDIIEKLFSPQNVKIIVQYSSIYINFFKKAKYYLFNESFESVIKTLLDIFMISLENIEYNDWVSAITNALDYCQEIQLIIDDKAEEINWNKLRYSRDKIIHIFQSPIEESMKSQFNYFIERIENYALRQ